MVTTEEILKQLVDRIAQIPEVESIGISSKTLPEAGEGDIDVFIYGSEIPYLQIRGNAYEGQIEDGGDIKMEVITEGHWGIADLVIINGVETWLMYFTCRETLEFVKAVQNGDYLDKQDNYFYPIGRLAMFRNMKILFDENRFLENLKQSLSEYPDKLAKKMIAYHLDQLSDTEDLVRAKTRSDVLFYHFALDLALDHFLMVLFALNRTFFPSRKRNLNYIRQFSVKPKNCEQRILQVLYYGCMTDGVNISYEMWEELVKDIRSLAANNPS